MYALPDWLRGGRFGYGRREQRNETVAILSPLQISIFGFEISVDYLVFSSILIVFVA